MNVVANSSFSGNLDFRPLDNGNYLVLQPFAYDLFWLGSAITIVVPAGFETDLASIPKVLRALFDKDDPHYLKPAVVHDWMYWCGYPRWFCDYVMLEGMKVRKCPRWKRQVVFRGVRAGGWGAYAKHRQAGHGLDVTGFSDRLLQTALKDMPEEPETEDEQDDEKTWVDSSAPDAALDASDIAATDDQRVSNAGA